MPLINNILLINPNCSDKTINRDMAGGLGYSAGDGVVLPPIDLLLLEKKLTQVGYKVFFLDALAENLNMDDVFQFIEKNKIKIVIGLLALPSIDEDIMFYKKLKNKGLDVVIKTGINYLEILKKISKKTGANKIIYGEPENDIDKLLFKKEKIINAGKIKNLDMLPIANRELLKNKLYKYILLPGVITCMQTSRGCPFSCGRYCPYPLVQGKIWRFMSPERVVREIEEIFKLGIKKILFRDATFTLDKKRTIDICKKIVAKRIKVKWWCETRANVVDFEVLRWMKRAGCRGINMGVESLDRDLIKSEGKPGVDVDMVIKVRDWGKRLGIKFHFLMIIGLPSDSQKSLYNTFRNLVKIKPETIGFSIITPYPGTELFDQAKKENLIKNFNWNDFRGDNCIMKTRNMSRFEIGMARLALMATSYFLKKPKLISIFALFFIDIYFRLWILIK